jgi:beta-N-acetylhexosaminidase
VGYDLISATSPDPDQTIPLMLDIPQTTPTEIGILTTPTPTPEYRVGDLIAVRTGVILDHNGHPVPDFTPVQFIYSSIDGNPIYQSTTTSNGIAHTTFLVESAGTFEISVESEPAKVSDVLRFDIPPPAAGETSPTPTPSTTDTLTPEPPPTSTITPTVTPVPSSGHHPDLGDWLLAIFISGGLGLAAYRLTTTPGTTRWGTRGGFLAQIGGMLAYTYLALGMPGSNQLLQNTGRWSVLMMTIFGAALGWGMVHLWRRIQTH